ncbi:hypothetical protein T01_4348 [Trichinella spiralis]|uniref:Uncharacterized protein n=1 Tax=Trichinella spiralis TaxID=6334 RepID=A0A0V0YRF9_TRISP|nr:hypothetical protein T01_4348 [Trichinella spiralis]
MTDERLPLWMSPDSGTGCDGHPDSASAIRKRYRW